MVQPRHHRLRELAAHLTKAADSATIIDLVAQEGVIALDAHIGRMSLLADDGNQFRSIHVTTHPEAHLPENVIDAWRTFAPDALSPVADAVRTRALIVLESREARLRRYPHLIDQAEPMHAWFVSPILLPSRPLGAIELHFLSPRGLEDEDRAYILTLTDLCAQALDRARLSEALRDETGRRQDLEEALRSIKEQGQALRGAFQRLQQEHETLRAAHQRLISRPGALSEGLLGADERAAWQRSFLRDMLSEATAGGLRLCYSADELPTPLTPVGGEIDLSQPSGVRILRQRARTAAQDMGLSEERVYDLEVAVGEVGTNAIAHAGSGIGTVSVEPGRRIQVRVADQGPGIIFEDIPRATLARGYSTRATLGHGFKIVLQTVDHVYLLTNPSGTTVVLEQDNRSEPAW